MMSDTISEAAPGFLSLTNKPRHLDIDSQDETREESSSLDPSCFYPLSYGPSQESPATGGRQQGHPCTDFMISDSHVSQTCIPHQTGSDDESELRALKQTLHGFIRLRAQSGRTAAPPTRQNSPVPVPIIGGEPIVSSSGRGVPQELVDNNTLCLSNNWSPPTATHYYLASMELIQKTQLSRSLRQQSIVLAERHHLAGVDLVMDPHTALMFTSLPALPSNSRDILDRLTAISWRYSHVLVVFEAFPPSCLFKSRRSSTESFLPYMFSSPVIKSVKKLRRDFAIFGACGDMRPETNVHFAFAQTVQEAAMLARTFGNLAEAADSSRAMWADRHWLEDDELEVAQVFLQSV
jgi:hypothetical protein